VTASSDREVTAAVGDGAALSEDRGPNPDDETGLTGMDGVSVRAYDRGTPDARGGGAEHGTGRHHGP